MRMQSYGNARRIEPSESNGRGVEFDRRIISITMVVKEEEFQDFKK